MRPYGVSEHFYNMDDEAVALEKIEEPRNLGKNSISPDILAQFLANKHIH